MKRFTNRLSIIAVLFFSVCCASVAHSQNVSGKWYGIGNPDIPGTSNSYLCEFIITQNGDKVSGYFNYFFRNGYFSNRLTGTYDAGRRLLLLKPLPILYHLSANVGTGVDCIMTGVFKLKVSKQDCTLSGMFESDDFHKYTSPPVKVRFYKLGKDEPELKERIKNKELVLETGDEDKAPAVTAPAAAVAPPPVTPAVSSQQPAPVQLNAAAIAATEKEMKTRANALLRILDVTADSVTVELYDNGQLDYDSISVFYNNKIVAYRQGLSTRRPVTLTVFVDSVESHNDLLMFAENLGTIPPNSALMIVKDKDNRYEIPLQSNYQKNAAVRLRRAAAPAAINNK